MCAVRIALLVVALGYLEHVGFDQGGVHGSVHTKRYHHAIGTQKTGRVDVPDAASAFHDFVLDWSPEHVRVSRRATTPGEP